MAQPSTTHMVRVHGAPRTGANATSSWLRGRDLNPQSQGYEPCEMPDFSTPRYRKLLEDQHIQTLAWNMCFDKGVTVTALTHQDMGRIFTKPRPAVH